MLVPKTHYRTIAENVGAVDKKWGFGKKSYNDVNVDVSVAQVDFSTSCLKRRRLRDEKRDNILKNE